MNIIFPFQDHLSTEMRLINELNLQLASLSKPVNPFIDVDQSRGRPQKRGENPKLVDHSTDRQILRLQDQNRQLTAEVGKQGQTIYELEQVFACHLWMVSIRCQTLNLTIIG